ncbi:hypothetical protein HDA30_000122 [Micrococcus cohnii]|uniref:DUF4245 domain-containing protein n=1 Tax=Micrococcus cohnii TaxID=993416 RepID=A0A7W7M221_9MICC|nr:hypothetical protein [Micrococcus cohnii]
MSSPGESLPPAPPPRLTPKQAKRASSSSVAMLLCVLATLGISAALMLLQPRPAEAPRQDRVDVAAEAETVRSGGGLDALAPAVPDKWDSSYARTRVTDGVPVWEAGWVVTDDVFAGLTQTDQSNPTWLSQETGNPVPGGEQSVGGVRWQPREAGHERHWVGEVDGDTVILTTTGDEDVLHELARAVTGP